MRSQLMGFRLAAILFGLMALGQMGRFVIASQTVASGPGSFVEIAGSKLYYEECGTGAQTVVLVHDGVVNSACRVPVSMNTGCSRATVRCTTWNLQWFPNGI